MSKHFFILVMLALAVPAPAQAMPKFVGPGSCSSSNCHGSVKPRNASNVLQNEYITWSKHDRHSRAYLSLLNQDSKRIAANLGIGDPSKEPLCLKCHSTYVEDTSRHGEKFKLEDGVSCESCHGPAEGWLESHTVTGTSHKENVDKGLKDLVSLDDRAELCLSCHYGTEEKTVNHDLYGAGHPRLSFELDTFGVLQPKHWVVDRDYEERKGSYVPVQAWLLGQLHNAEAALTALESPVRSKNGLYPELSLFDCYSCHHSLTEDQWKQRSYNKLPGQLKLNLPSLVILREASAALDSSIGEELGTHLATLHTSYKKDGAPEAINALQNTLSEKVRPLILKVSGATPVSSRILRALASYAATHPWPTFELAEQLGMGMQATIASSSELARLHEAQLKELFKTLKSSEAFAAERFTTAAKKLDRSVNNRNS